jgi:hypothetical protein
MCILILSRTLKYFSFKEEFNEMGLKKVPRLPYKVGLPIILAGF